MEISEKRCSATRTGIAVLIFILLTAFSAVAAEKTGSAEDVKKETKEALRAIKEYSADQRDETVKKVKTVITELDADIGRLETRIENEWNQMDKEARQNARATLKSLRKQRNELGEWYGGIQHGSAEAWKEVKDGFIKSFNILQESFNKAAQEF